VEEARDKLKDDELPTMKRRSEELDAKATKATAEAQEVCDINTVNYVAFSKVL